MGSPHDLIVAICDHFVAMQSSYGRPDPSKTRFASGSMENYMVSSMNLHSTPSAALALYKAGRKLSREDYVKAADLYTLFLLSTLRDPYGEEFDFYTKEWQRQLNWRWEGKTRSIFAVSWQYGAALDTLCRGFMVVHPYETSLRSKAAALYDWLQCFRTSRGPYFRVGYGWSKTGHYVDAANSDDLGIVGRGLASYYKVSKRKEVLDDLIGLSGYFLRSHQYNSDDGCFSEEIGSWVVGPWPHEISGEHMPTGMRLDNISWGYSVREAVDFLTQLYGWIEESKTRQLIRDRTTRGMKWVFDNCQFEDGAIGMFGHDDAFTGMTAAGILNFLDCRDVGLLNDEEEANYGHKARKAMSWILSWSPETIIEEAGHKYVNGGVALSPPENLAWMLAWTVEALLRIEDL